MRIKRPAAQILGVVLVGIGLGACSSNVGTSSESGNDCTPKNSFTTVKDGVITAAVTEVPPVATYGNGDPSGVDVDILKAIAALECIDIDFKATGYSAAVPEVQNGRVDVALGGFYRSKARSEIVGLSAPLYLDQMTIISRDGVSTIADIEQRGLRVGSIDGYLWGAEAKSVFGAKFSTYPSGVEMMADLKANRIDVGFDGFGLSTIAVQGTDFKIAAAEPDNRIASTLEPAQMGFPISKDNAAMSDAFEKYIAELRADGTLAKILKSNGLNPEAAEVGEPRLVG